MSVHKGEGGSRGWSMWTFFCLKILLFQKWFRKINNLHHNYQKKLKKKLFLINHGWFCYKKFSKKKGGIWKVHMVSKGGQPKVHVRSTRGEEGQKVLKIGPHGLWTTPKFICEKGFHEFLYSFADIRALFLCIIQWNLPESYQILNLDLLIHHYWLMTSLVYKIFFFKIVLA